MRQAVRLRWSVTRTVSASPDAERLRLGIAVIHGEAQDAESDLVDGRHSPPMVRSAAAIHPSLEIPSKHGAPSHFLFAFKAPYSVLTRQRKRMEPRGSPWL